MIDQSINFVIRPPRAEYDTDQYLWEKSFSLADRSYKRKDLELTNRRGHSLMCSHYMPSLYPEDSPLPCVVYCHGSSGCRADANEAAMILLPSNITVFTLDFSGSGLSDGRYVSLGWHEKDDLRTVVSYLRKNKRVSRIGLWGRSMGAVTSLLYGLEDPLIAGMVLDSPFSNLVDLMMDLVEVYKIRLPKFTVAPKILIPALFGHANEDKFIRPYHSEIIFKTYAGDKNIIKFEGDHNSSRPRVFYDSVSKFFSDTLHPPQVASTSSNSTCRYKSGEVPKVSNEMDENLLYELIASLRVARAGAVSSSSTPNLYASEPIGDILTDVPISNINEKMNAEYDEFCSYTSSARESWGRCSSLGGSDSAANIVSTDTQQISPNPLKADQDCNQLILR